MRVYRYRLIDKPDTWLTIIAPDCDLEEARRSLRLRFGERLTAVVEHRHRRLPRWPQPRGLVTEPRGSVRTENGLHRLQGTPGTYPICAARRRRLGVHLSPFRALNRPMGLSAIRWKRTSSLEVG